MNNNKVKAIAFYLPQYHPSKENDLWWGKGFTEWTNVGKSKPLYPGHYQPRVPADLGYYDLRLPEVRLEQATMAQQAGISAFCYWHYWFGNGKQLLRDVLDDVVNLKQPNFPFCIGWANHSWMKKNWNNKISRFDNSLLIEQTYPGKKDVDEHFYAVLNIFKDVRYFRIHGKLLMYIYKPSEIPDLQYFLSRWQELALLNGLPGFCFVFAAYSTKDLVQEYMKLADCIALDLKYQFFSHVSVLRKLSYFLPIPLNIRTYSSMVKFWFCKEFKLDKVYPIVYPNWDHSARMGRGGTILHGSSPELFKTHIDNTLSQILCKQEDDRIIFIKSWNEWAEGNYLEPDLKYGMKYLNVLKELLVK